MLYRQKNRMSSEDASELAIQRNKGCIAEVIGDPDIDHLKLQCILDENMKQEGDGQRQLVRLHRLQEKYEKNELTHQHRHPEDAKVIAHLKQELRKSRQCMSKLDNSMELQIQSIEKAPLAKGNLWKYRYSIWEEVSAAKRTRLDEGP
uniref:Uncharacterized protein n=1 Tax=Solanum tuberosum TaxID=4113 RepID=M1DDQ1_SOLTU